MKKYRVPALFACILLCLAMTLSLTFIAMESGHLCTDNQCRVCEEIARCEALLTKLTATTMILSLLFYTFCFVFLPNLASRERDMAPTPVSMKVKLLN